MRPTKRITVQRARPVASCSPIVHSPGCSKAIGRARSRSWKNGSPRARRAEAACYPRLMRRLVLLLLLAVASPTPSLSAQAAARAQAAQKHFLWAIKAPSAPPTYLLGSLHMLSADYYPLSPVIERAFAQSTVLIEEIDLDEVNNPMTTLQLLGKALLTDGRTLDQIIAPDLYKQVVVKAEAAGLPIAAIQRMKPWMAAATLTTPSMQAAGFDPGLGIDKHFFDRA